MSPRIIDLQYRGRSVKLTVKSAFEEITARIDCMIRNVGIGFTKNGETKPVLVPLFCETALIPNKVHGQEIDDDVLTTANATRACANAVVPEDQHDNGAQVKLALKENESVFTMIDPSFRIEMAWFQNMASSGAQELLESNVFGGCLMVAARPPMPGRSPRSSSP